MRAIEKTVMCAALLLAILGGLDVWAEAAEDAAAASEEEPAEPTAWEGIAKVGIEAVLSIVLDTKVSVERVRLDGANEVFEVQGLRIANPKGFDQDKPALVFDKLLLEAPGDVLSSEKPIIRKAVASGGQLNVITDFRKGNNIKRLVERASRFGGGDSGDDNKRWIVEQATIQENRVTLTTGLGGDFPLRQVRRYRIDPIEMAIKGEDGQGVSTGDAIGAVLDKLWNSLQLEKVDDEKPSLEGLLDGWLGR